MPFIDHTHAWLRGEAIDMAVLAAIGLALILLAGGLWRFVTTPLGQALVIPTLLIAALFVTVGLYGCLSTPGKIAQASAAYAQDAGGFILSEQNHVAGFAQLYAYTLIGAAISFALALGIFVLTDHATWRAIGIALVFLGLSAMTIDGFSKERAAIYATQIEKAL
jgi:hypothetical protein